MTQATLEDVRTLVADALPRRARKSTKEGHIHNLIYHIGSFGTQILDRSSTQIDVVSSIAETSIYSFSIPANKIGATGAIRLTIAGDLLVNGGANDTVAVKVKLGSTTILTIAAADFANNASRYKWRMEVLCLNSSAAAQKCFADFQLVVGDAWAVQDSGTASSSYHTHGLGSATEDTTAARTLDVTVQWSASSASNSFRKELAILELLPLTTGGGASGAAHSSLTGLIAPADDHTQYLLASGTRAGSTSQAQSFGATGIKADVIAESTAAAGVTVDGLLIKDGDASVFALLAGRAGTANDLTLTTSAATGTLAGSSDTAGTLTLRANTVDATGILVLSGQALANAVLTGDFDVSGVSAFGPGQTPSSTVQVKIGSTVTQSASLLLLQSNLDFTLSAACAAVTHWQTAGLGVTLGGFTLTAFSGVDTRLELVGAGTVTQLAGNRVALNYYTTPIVTTAVGYWLQAGGVGGPNASSGNIYGYRVDNIGHASWDNIYAVYIADQTAGTATFSIYQTGTTGLNVLNANTRIGSTVAPTVALDVTGAAIVSSTITVGTNAQVLDSPAAGVMSCGADFRVVGNDIENSAGTKQITFSTTNNTVKIADRLGVNTTPLVTQRMIVSTFPEASASETILLVGLQDTLTTNRTSRFGFTFTGTVDLSTFNLTNLIGLQSAPAANLDDDSVTAATLTAYAAFRAGINIASTGVLGTGPTVTRADAIIAIAPSLGANAYGSFPTLSGVRILNQGNALVTGTSIALDIEAQSGSTTATYTIRALGTADSIHQPNLFVGANTAPTAKLHLGAGTTAASTAPLKFTSGSLMTTAEAGAVEFLTDKAYLTITTGAARKEFTLNDAALTSGRIPAATTNGRLTDGPTPVADATYTPVVSITTSKGLITAIS